MRLVAKPDFAQRRLVVLAPADCQIPDSFLRVEEDPKLHATLLAGIQTLRGALYLQDGAITSEQLCPSGRLQLPIDDASWHLLAVNRDGTVCGGARYRETSHRIPFSQLPAGASSLAHADIWGTQLLAGVEADLDLARQRDVAYWQFAA